MSATQQMWNQHLPMLEIAAFKCRGWKLGSFGWQQQKKERIHAALGRYCSSLRAPIVLQSSWGEKLGKHGRNMSRNDARKPVGGR
jgi:hypothetical protein